MPPRSIRGCASDALPGLKTKCAREARFTDRIILGLAVCRRYRGTFHHLCVVILSWFGLFCVAGEC
jgi:hypothetical protein